MPIADPRFWSAPVSGHIPIVSGLKASRAQARVVGKRHRDAPTAVGHRWPASPAPSIFEPRDHCCGLRSRKTAAAIWAHSNIRLTKPARERQLGRASAAENIQGLFGQRYRKALFRCRSTKGFTGRMSVLSCSLVTSPASRTEPVRLPTTA